MSDPTFMDYMRARDAAFENDNLEWVRAQKPDASQELIETSFHKARLECWAVSEGKRRESQRWLIERGLSRMNGLPINEGDPLPDTLRPSNLIKVSRPL